MIILLAVAMELDDVKNTVNIQRELEADIGLK
ncbi:hypothetical protein NVIE_025680 [Nitrososphaera viennensis EN76]|uniref:Uncharacterized protein n=1 Tax=Nitrososphaera viennensis EN76 TaxID=926571 RepID=A0A060HMX0_9ARCH|nr:hypothetical protein NVIE_025680 [Nitrososphaera viennensis EN76]